ncbi:redox-sensitive transcriptional activator SoxR, partial [Streptomyces sp. NPDC059744]
NDISGDTISGSRLMPERRSADCR